jgi:hypothetical protein
LSKLIEENNKQQEKKTIESQQSNNYETITENTDYVLNDENSDNDIKQQIIDELNDLLPDHFVCNSQIPF